MSNKMLDAQGLHERGITFSTSQRNLLIRRKQFPRPVYLGRKPVWPEKIIEEYLAAKIKAAGYKVAS